LLGVDSLADNSFARGASSDFEAQALVGARIGIGELMRGCKTNNSHTYLYYCYCYYYYKVDESIDE
jgi:hypothetical protein